MFALPMETAAHAPHLASPITDADYGNKVFSQVLRDLDPSKHAAPPPWADLSDCINWVRVYKNPKTTLAGDIPGSSRSQSFGRGLTRTTVTYRTIPGVATAELNLQPSLEWERFDPMWDHQGGLWVDFNTETGDGSLLPDPAKDASETGLVTATENTTVKPGDRVAIAVNFNTWGGWGAPDMTIGPRQDITYRWQREDTVEVLDEFGNEQQDPNDPTPGAIWQKKIWENVALTHREGPWRLNPNATLRGNQPNQKHTFVYQFVVGEEHALLNEGPWLQQDFYYEADTGADPRPGFRPSMGHDDGPYFQVNGPTKGNREIAIDWLYGEPDGTLPPSTALKVWNVLVAIDSRRVNWGTRGSATATLPFGEFRGWTRHRIGNNADWTRDHRHVPMYDTAVKPPIYYPKVVVGDTDVTTVSSSTAITDVPSGTQTGEFQVTLRFSEVQEIADFTVDRRTFDGVKSAVVEGSIPLPAPPARSDLPVPGASLSLFVAHDVSAAGGGEVSNVIGGGLGGGGSAVDGDGPRRCRRG